MLTDDFFETERSLFLSHSKSSDKSATKNADAFAVVEITEPLHVLISTAMQSVADLLKTLKSPAVLADEIDAVFRLYGLTVLAELCQANYDAWWSHILIGPSKFVVFSSITISSSPIVLKHYHQQHPIRSEASPSAVNHLFSSITIKQQHPFLLKPICSQASSSAAAHLFSTLDVAEFMQTESLFLLLLGAPRVHLGFSSDDVVQIKEAAHLQRRQSDRRPPSSGRYRPSIRGRDAPRGGTKRCT